MKTGMWMKAVLICGIAASMGACLTEQRNNVGKKMDMSATPAMTRMLVDACTGDPIGAVDRNTGDYELDDGRVIARSIVIPDDSKQATLSCDPDDGWTCWRTLDSSCSGCCADGTTCWESCPTSYGTETSKTDKRKQSLYFPE